LNAMRWPSRPRGDAPTYNTAGGPEEKGGNLYAKGGDYGLRDLLTLFLKPGARSSLKDFWGLR